MKKEDLQLETGHFTRIINPLIESLISVPFKGCELALVLFVIRKTYGFGKTEDEISLSQFCVALHKTKPSIVKALKNLQLVNILILVKRGDSIKHANLYKINKYSDTWKLVNKLKLVKGKSSTSKHPQHELVKARIQTKETLQKKDTKERIIESSEQGSQIQEVMNILYEVNKTLNFGNTTERKACSYLIDKFGLEHVCKMATAVVQTRGMPYAPIVTKPSELRDKWSKIETFIVTERSKHQKNSVTII